MARRRSTTSAIGGNLDSMLDTLMNVVGILVIVLVAVQLSSQEAASRIAEALEKIDPQEVARLEAAAAQAKQQAAAAAVAIREQRQAVMDPRSEVSKLEAELQIEEDLASEAAKRAATLEAQRAAEVAAARKAAELAESKDVAKRQDQQASLEARLSDLQRELKHLPVLPPPPPKEVRLPDPRPSPSGVTELFVLCRDEKIWLVDIAALQEKALKRADFVVRSKKLDPDNDRWITDGKTFVEEFNKAPVKEGGFDMTLEIANARWPRLVLNRMKGSGESVEQAAKSSGDYARTLRRHSPDTHVLRFLVWPDSFETYLEVRERAGERGFAAGWEPMTTPDEYRIPLGKYAIGEKPPPRPPDSTPKPPRPPPPNVLD